MSVRRSLALTSTACGLVACAGLPPDDSDFVPPMDIHSHARPAEVAVQSVSLDLTADFQKHELSGAATLRVKRRDPAAPLRLDTDGLHISAVTVDGTTECEWSIGKRDANLGAPLTIRLPDGAHEVTVRYRTDPSADAVQWLDPAQTDGGSKPFLFTQGQAILTRTWIPLQDSPGVRITYDATIRVDTALGVVPVMSANERERVEAGVYRFSMDKPVPPYLIALAIGDLDRREISPRCAIWAEPGVVERAAAELADTETMIATCESLYGPYRWGRYDVLILPPAFPFGGMENPCLTFATPTILAGDRSLVALIAHELAHSWSGNLVTNATWRDFWLNEGFTVYLEQRIVEAIYGPERARMETLIGLQQLAKELRSMPKDDQKLHIDLRGRNPDDGMTSVPYDKGAAFLRRLEELFGRGRFDAFLTRYFDAHAFRSITTEEFLDYLETELLAGAPDLARQIDVEAWVRGPGIPADNPEIESAAFEVVEAARAEWIGGAAASSLDTRDWVTTQWLHFLRAMPESVDAAKMADLDDAFGFTQSGNSEILALWLELAIARGYRAADARLDQFLMTVGRRKFLKPLYEALVGVEGGRERARDIYERARPRYHAVSRRTLDEIVGT